MLDQRRDLVEPGILFACVEWSDSSRSSVLSRNLQPKLAHQVLPHEFAAARGNGGGRSVIADGRLGRRPGTGRPTSEMLRSFNHRCRNSLNGIKMSLYLFKREASGPLSCRFVELERTYRAIERSFDRFQVIYRPVSLTMVRSPFGQLVADRLPSWRAWFGSNRHSFQIEAPDQDLAGGLRPDLPGVGVGRTCRMEGGCHVREVATASELANC